MNLMIDVSICHSDKAIPRYWESDEESQSMDMIKISRQYAFMQKVYFC